jgi:hypothetical protein
MFYHDRRCMKEKTFQPGEQIFVKLTDRQKSGKLGFVENKAKSRSYELSVNGGTYRQNSYHMKPAGAQSKLSPGFARHQFIDHITEFIFIDEIYLMHMEILTIIHNQIECNLQ